MDIQFFVCSTYLFIVGTLPISNQTLRRHRKNPHLNVTNTLYLNRDIFSYIKLFIYYMNESNRILYSGPRSRGETL